MIEAYFFLYFDDKKFKVEGVARNMISLFREANLTDKTSLEELCVNILLWDEKLDIKDQEKKKGLFYFDRGVFKYLWENFTKSLDYDEERPTMRACLTIFAFC